MTILVTGAAGFIGFHVCQALLARGETVLGVDNLNDYYDVSLKEGRLAQLTEQPGFTFLRLDISDKDAILALADSHPEIRGIINLAAQAGVRYSLIDPYAYVQANVLGHLVMMELARRLPKLEHFVYASSSSVYGGNTDIPFSVQDRVDKPVSLYAATKRSDELMGHTYAHLYRIPMSGLRFFTVYGPWGRPDMAAFIFTKAILEEKPIKIFNHGDMRRDFTYVDDIVAGVLATLDTPPQDGGVGQPPHRVFNLGNHKPEDLLHFVELLEGYCGRKAIRELHPIQPGDVKETYADIAESQAILGFQPKTSLEQGLERFVGWYKHHYGWN